MASYNKIFLIGNLGRDPEVREFQGRKVANFSLAVNERYTKSDGTPVERTEWFRISFWGKTAEIAENYLRKGSQVMVEGRLSTREYVDKDGNNRIALEVSGQGLQLLSGQAGQDTSSMSSGSPSYNPGPETPSTPPSNNHGSEAGSDDDLPF